MSDSVYILEVDAKDLWLANYAENADTAVGYKIRNKKGDIWTKKFIGALNYSLDLIKMRDVYHSVLKNREFSFAVGRKEYSKYVIDVTFEYSVKEYNLINKNTYIKVGYDYQDLLFKDGVAIKDDILVGIKTNEAVAEPIPQALLGKNFVFANGIYKAKDNFKTVRGTEALREEMYTNGFMCDGEKYVRYKRSSGSSRQGKCLFIHEALYDKMMKWSRCGILDVEKMNNIDLAAFEAYISLTLSGIIDTIEIMPENILVVDDYNSVFKSPAIITEEIGGKLRSDLGEAEISNNIWDGLSLLDESLFPEKYKKYGMLLLRTRMFKSCGFHTKIQKWFEDNGITEISQVKGFTLATDISQIKMITTPSSIKYLKFGTLQEWFKRIDSTFGVVKHEKPPYIMRGRMVQSHYQLINTLQMSYEEVEKFLEPSMDYVRKLRDDSAILRNHISFKEIGMLSLPVTSKNDVVYNLMGINDRFCETKLYDDFKKDTIASYKNNMKRGHVWINGNYSTMVGNPVEMLLKVIGKFDGSSQMGVGNIYSKRFPFGKTILASRSPHVCASNVYLAYNAENEMIDKYFNFTKEIIVVNSIGENLLDRLSGSDFDSDTVMITDNEILIEAAKRNYDKFIVPYNAVKAKKTARTYTPQQLADLDNKTGKNKIGDIVNLAQELTTIFWDNINNGESFEENMPLYYDIITLDILSNIEIDKAKREFNVNSINEIRDIRMRHCVTDEGGKSVKPMFFGHIAKKKGYYDPNKKAYNPHNTSMDYLQDIVGKDRARRSKKAFLRFKDLLNRGVMENSCVNYYQIHEIVDMINECNAKIININENQHCVELRMTKTQEFRNDVVDYISKLKINDATMYILLTYIEKPKYSKISRNLFYILFGYPNKYFYSIVNRSKEPVPLIVERQDGKINLFGYTYNKILK